MFRMSLFPETNLPPMARAVDEPGGHETMGGRPRSWPEREKEAKGRKGRHDPYNNNNNNKK
jgi:hypothetical protein